VNGLLRVCQRCGASNRSALRHSHEGNEGTYFLALGEIACLRGGRCLYVPDVTTFGCDLLAEVFYRLEAFAFANGFLFLEAHPLQLISSDS